MLMKLGEIAVHMDNCNFTKFHQNQMKNKKVLLIARFSVQNFKVSVESWKSYIVREDVRNFFLGGRRKADITADFEELQKSKFLPFVRQTPL